MAGFYDEMTAFSSEMITEFGFTATLIRSVKSGTDEDPEYSDTEIDVTIAIMDFSWGLVDGTQIKAGDRKIYMTAATEPTTADKLRISGKDNAIITVKPLAPAGTAVMYEVQVRA